MLPDEPEGGVWGSPVDDFNGFESEEGDGLFGVRVGVGVVVVVVVLVPVAGSASAASAFAFASAFVSESAFVSVDGGRKLDPGDTEVVLISPGGLGICFVVFGLAPVEGIVSGSPSGGVGFEDSDVWGSASWSGSGASLPLSVGAERFSGFGEGGLPRGSGDSFSVGVGEGGGSPPPLPPPLPPPSPLPPPPSDDSFGGGGEGSGERGGGGGGDGGGEASTGGGDTFA